LFDDVLQPVGLRSTQFVTLVSVYISQPVNLSALARDMVMDRSTLTRNIQVLERSDHVVSEAAPGSRTRLYSLTDKGLETVSRGIPLWEKAQSTFIEHLGEKNWPSLLAGLEDSVNAARQI